MWYVIVIEKNVWGFNQIVQFLSCGIYIPRDPSTLDVILWENMDSNPGPVSVMGESPKEMVHLNPDHGECKMSSGGCLIFKTEQF